MKFWLIVIGLAVLGSYAAFTWLLPGAFSAKGTPSDVEVSLARWARHWAVPEEYRHADNPIPQTPEHLADALHHFADHCATCHGNDGSGKTAMGPNFYPPVPDLRTPMIQSMSDGELFFAIHFGVRFTGMPAWGDGKPERDAESWKLVHFIRHLPNITPHEIAAMKQYNPMTKAKREEQEALDRFLAGDDPDVPEAHHH